MLQKAGRDGPEASTKTEKKHDPFPDIPIPEIPQSDRRSEFRNPVWFPQLTHGYTADMRRTNYQWSWHQADQAPNQTPPELVFSLDLPGFFQLPRKSQKKRQIPPPNLPANEAKGSSLNEKQHVSLIAGTKTTIAPAFLLSTRISPALGNLRC